MSSLVTAGWESVRRATTEDEREAIYRFRYEVYVHELHRRIGGVDHERRMVRDTHDESGGTIHLYVGPPSSIVGVMRVEPWAPGAVPTALFEEYSMAAFPGIAGLATAELARLMVRPSARGRLVVPSLLRASYELLTRDHGTQLAFGSCRPGLVAHYNRLGFRTYEGRLMPDSEGISLPIVMVCADPEHLERAGAPMADIARASFGPAGRPPLDMAPYAALFRQTNASVVTDATQVWLDMQSELMLGSTEAPALLAGLDEGVVRRLAAFGVVVEVPAGALITREGHVERELFVILEGCFEAFSGERVFSRMNKGEAFGEVAFFRGGGERSASVRAQTDGRLVVLRRSALAELGRVDPAAAHTLLFNLARILADRVVHLGASPAST